MISGASIEEYNAGFDGNNGSTELPMGGSENVGHPKFVHLRDRFEKLNY